MFRPQVLTEVLDAQASQFPNIIVNKLCLFAFEWKYTDRSVETIPVAHFTLIIP